MTALTARAAPPLRLNAVRPYFTMFPLDFFERGTTLFAARPRGLGSVGVDTNPVCLCDEFLGLNGHRLDGDDLELAQLVWGVAREAGSLTDSTVAERLRPFVHRGTPDVAFAERHPATIDNLAN